MKTYTYIPRKHRKILYEYLEKTFYSGEKRKDIAEIVTKDYNRKINIYGKIENKIEFLADETAKIMAVLHKAIQEERNYVLFLRRKIMEMSYALATEIFYDLSGEQ